MSTAVYDTKRARVHLRDRTQAHFEDVNIVDTASYAFQEDTITKESTNEVIGTVAKKVIKTSGTYTMVMSDTQFKNFCRVARARVSSQAAAPAATFTLPALEAGQSFKLPHVNVSAVVIAGKVLNVDYKVFGNSGLVALLTDNVTAIEGCTYAAGVASRAAIAAGAQVEYEVLIDDVIGGETTMLYRWSPSLPANVSLISPTEWGTYEITGDLLLDDSKPSDGDLGQFGQKLVSLNAA